MDWLLRLSSLLLMCALECRHVSSCLCVIYLCVHTNVSLLNVPHAPDQPAHCFLLITHFSPLFLSHCSTPCPRPLLNNYLPGPSFPCRGRGYRGLKPVGASHLGSRARSPLLLEQRDPNMVEAEALRPATPSLPHWSLTKMAWLPRALARLCAAKSLLTSLLSTLIWGFRNGARMVPTPCDRSWPSFWHPNCILAGSSGVTPCPSVWG